MPQILTVLLTLQIAVGQLCLPGFAQEVPPAEPAAGNLDLSSSDRNVAASTVLQSSNQATINLGGNAVTYGAGDMITAAEMVAVRQMVATGRQFLQLNEQGVAVGGGLHLQYYATGLNNLVIPEGVRASQNAAVLSTLSLTGNLTNSGTLNVFSSNAAVTALTINASNIYNNAGALLTSSLATLNLNAVNNIVNAGTIYSAGNLNMTAGGSITNTAVMQAVNAMSLASGAGNIVNSGLISSLTSNISVSTQTISNLLVNNTGGIMQALNGNINVRDALYSAKSNTSLVGGDWLSQQLNVHSGNGIVDIGVEQLTGKLNVYAGEVHVQAATDNLQLGDMIITGDPTYYNTLGDVTIGGSLVFSGQALAIVARNNIVTTAGAGAIDTSSTTGNGGLIYMAAGVTFTSNGPSSANNDTTSTLTVTGRSAEGGKIDLATGNAITSLTSRGSTSSGNGNGGNIQLIAFRGTASDSGTIKLPTSFTITSGGGGTGNNGNVFMVGEALTGTGIEIGSVNTTGGTGTTTQGSISLVTDVSGSSSFPMSITNGTGGNIGSISDIGATSSSILTGALTAQTNSNITGNTINITAGGAVFINGNISLNSLASSTRTGSLAISSNTSTSFTIGAGASGSGINGTVSVNAGTAGPGGTINIRNNGTGGITLTNPANLSSTATSGAGATIGLRAMLGPLSIATGSLNASAATSGAGGNITLFGTTISVTGGSTLTLNASGVAAGNGGILNITATAAGSTLGFTNGAGDFIINAGGGTTSGTGGNVTASAGGNLTYNATINIAPSATNATGGSISLTAGTNGPGSLSISNGLSVSGNGTGASGTLTLQANSSTALTIGNNLTASGGTGGGTIKIGNIGTGGITFSISNALTATATGSSGAGGTIIVDAGTLGTITTSAAGTWSANASTNGGASGAGGSITIRAGTFTNSSGSALTLTANGAQSSSISIGGTITITTHSATSDLSVDNTAGSISISAQPGTSSFAAGGIVSIYAGRNLTVDPASLVTTNNGNEVTGPILTLAAGTAGAGNLFVDGSLNVSPFSCSCGSNGGTINLFSNSTTSFNVSASATTNGVKGTLTSDAGNIGSSAGTINIINYGTGGVNIEDPDNIIIGGNNAGGGGTLKIEAPVGTLSFQQGGTLAVNGNVGSPGNGGTVTLLGRYITVSGGTPLTISTSAESTGHGGSVTLTTLASDSDLTLGNSSGQFIVNSNAIGTGARNGGTVTISTGRNLTINTAQLTATASGNGTGAPLTLTAGTGGSGNLFITGNLAAQGIGTGAGGTIILNSNSSTVFDMDSGATTNGITGQIQAQGGSGGGGTIRMRNFGTGGITIDSALSLLTAPTSGNGGTVEINAGLGVLTFNTADNLIVDAVTSGIGGTVTLTARSFSIDGVSSTAIQASGAGSGNGGNITLVSTSPTQDVDISLVAFQLVANSGSSGGNGGVVSVSSGRDIFLDPSALSIGPLGTNGNGGQLTLNSGTSAAGTLRVTNSLNLSGAGTGSGGSVTLSTRSSSAFIVGTSATTIGVDGTITVQDGATGSGTADGGTVSITNLGSGGITLDAASNISVNRTTGSAGGGVITLNAGSGVLTIPSGTLSANGTGTSSNGFRGGTITLTASSLNITGGALTVQANANSAGSSPGGIISITTTSNTYDMVVGSGSGQLIVQAIASNCSGCSGIATGGTAILSSGRHLTVDPGSININPTQSGGAEAGTMTLTAGTTGFGNLFISGTLNVNGNNNGGGGTVTLTSNSPTAFTIGSGASTNGVNGNINAQSGSLGGNVWGGGTINVINNGTGGITLTAASVISVAVNGSNGYGGDILLNAGSGTLTIPTGTISANAVGNSFGNPGPTITLSANLISITGGALTLTANAGTNGFGGTISITQTSAAADLTVGTGSGQFILSAIGASTSGQGGTISLSSGRHLTIDPASITAAPGTSGKGATYSFTAGSTATSGNLFINGNLNAIGQGSLGVGGNVTLVSRSATAFNVAAGATTNGVNGTITVNNSSTATTGGTISITNNGTGGITLGSASNLSVNNSGTNATGGTITLNAGTGVLTIPSGTLSVNAQGTSTHAGGTITITAYSLAISGGALTLTANGATSGNGGTVSVTTTSFDYEIVVGNATGNLIISATGGAIGTLSAGNGGTVALDAQRFITIDPDYLTVKSYSYGTTGPNISLITGGPLGGYVTVSGNLSASSGSFLSGNGGTIYIEVNAPFDFTIAPGTASNGIDGTISAAGGLQGNGGTITIVNNAYGISIPSLANISVAGGIITGKGGSISLTTSTGSSGVITLPSGTINLSAQGSGNNNGGTFFLSANTLTLTGGSALTIMANATGTGNGGSISFNMGGNWTLGTGAGNLNLFANGGSAFSASGNAGSISVTSTTGSLTVAPSSMLSQALGSSGNGATFALSANSNVFINGSLYAVGRGTGNGGSITLSSNSSTLFNIATGASTNGVNGVLIATPGNTSGNGGTISVSNSGAGGITLSTINSVANRASYGGGAGGTLSFSAPNNAYLTIPTGTYIADASGTSTAAGGTISFVGSSLLISGGTALTISSMGRVSGNGGSVTVTSMGGTISDLTIGSGNISIFAQSGVSGGNGGTVSVSAQRHLTVDPAFIVAAPAGTSGNGASITLIGGNGGSGNLAINGSLSVSGKGTGNGGSITLSSVSAAAFTTGSNTGFNYINGTLSARGGGTSGNSGTISLTNTSTGGLTIGALSNISLTPMSGNGGNLTLSSNSGTLTIPTGTLSVNGVGTNANGGTVNLSASTISITGGALAITANASGIGNGGTVSVTSIGSTSDLTLGSSSGQINISATGGSAGSTAGNGGTAVLSSGRHLTVNNTFDPNVGPQGANGNGGNLTLVAGTGGSGNLVVNGSLTDSQGVGTGNGGTISITYRDATNSFVVGSAVTNSGVSGVIYAGALLNGTGGSITIANSASAALSISGATAGQLLADSVYGNAGTITLSKAGQAVNVNLLVLEGKVVSTGTSVSLQSQGHTGGGLFRPQTISSTAGNVLIYSDLAPIAVASSATVAATDGNVTIQHSGTDPGTGAPYIRLGQNSTISASSTDPGEGRIYVVIGAIPPSPVAGSAPSNFSSNLSNGGQVFFGTNGITASAPTNTANVDGARVVFDTGSLNSTYIVLDGGVVLNSTGTPSVAILTSLDLTDSTVTSYIQTQQGLGNLGGTLILSSGVAQPGSTLTIQPDNLSTSLSSFNIPTGVVVTMDSFTGSDTITIDITGSSFTNQATLTGTTAFGSGSGTLVINSTLAGTAFLVNSAGVLSSSAVLDISTNRSASIAGTITASTLNITTTANNGAISVTGSITGSSGMNLTTHGTGTVTSGASSFILSTNSAITISANDIAFSGSVNAGTGTVTLRPNGTQSMSLNGAGGTFSVLSTDLNAIIAGTLVLGSNTSTGAITLAAALTLPGSGTPGTTAGLYNLDLRSGASGGTYSAGSNSLNVRGQNLTINVAGSADTGSGGISGTTGTVSITGGGITIGSAINLTGNGTINLTATTNTNITLNGSLSTGSGGQISFLTGSGFVSQGSITISTGSLTLSSTSGNFNLTTSVTNLTANTSNSVIIVNTGALTIGPGGATNTGGNFNISNDQDIIVAGTITSTSLTMSTTANNGDIDFNASVSATGAGGISISTNGTGNVTNASLTNIGATNGQITITANNVIFNGTVSSTNAGVTLQPNGSKTISIGGTSGTFQVTSSVINAITASNCLCVGGGSGMVVDSSLDLSSTPFSTISFGTSTGDYSAAGTTLTIGDKYFKVEQLNPVGGNINTGTVSGSGSSSQIYFHALNGTVSATGNLSADTVRLQTDDGNINISANLTGTGGGGSIDLTTINSGTISQLSGSITAASLTLFSPSSIGAGTPLQTTVSSLTVNTSGSASASITNAGALQIQDSAVQGNLTITTTGTNAHITTQIFGNVQSVSGALTLNANGNITNSIPLSGNTVVLTTTTGSNGTINLNRNVTGTNGVTITTDGTGNVFVAATRQLSSTNALISITANDVTFSGTVNAGTSGNVTLIPNGAKSISIGGAGGTLSVTATDLANITANTLTVGTTLQAGGFTVAGNLNVSGAGPAGAYNLVFNNGGNYTAVGRTITLGTKTLTVNALGTVDTGAVTGGNTTVSLTGGTGLTASAAVTVTAGSVLLATSNNGNIILSANVGGGTTTTLDAHGTGTLTRTGNFTVSGTTVNLASDTGSIGTLGSPMQTAATTLSVNTGSPGTGFVTNAGAVTLAASTVGGNFTVTTTGASANLGTSGSVISTSGTLTLNVNGNITASNPLSGNSLTLTTTSGSNGNVVLNANATGTTGVTITTDGTGTVQNAVSTSISSTNSTIAITARDISFAGTVNSGNTFVMLAPNATASISVAGSSGTFSITSSDLAAITAGILSIGSTPANGRASGGVTFEGPVDTSGAGPNQAYHLQVYNTGVISNNGQTITAGNRQVYMSAFGAIDTGTITGGTTGVSLETFSSSGITVSGSISVAGGGALSLRNFANNGGVVVNGNVSSTGITQLIAQGSGSITQTSGTISGATVTLTSDTGNIGSVGTALNTSGSTLNVNTGGTGIANISNAGAISEITGTVGGNFTVTTTGGSANITSSGALTSSNGQLSINPNGNFQSTGSLSGSTILVQTSSNGSITLDSGATASSAGSINFVTNGTGNVTISNGSSVTTTNAAINFTANDVAITGASSLNSGTANVTLQPNGNKSISVSGTGGTFNLTSTDLGSITANTLIVGTTAFTGDFTVEGAINVSGAGAGAYNLAFNNGGSYTAAGQTITLGTKTLTVNALGTLNTGTVTGGNTTIQLSGGTGMTVSGAVTVTAGTVNLVTTNNGTITLGANVGGGSSTTLNVDGTGNVDISGSGFNVTGTTVNLIGDTGTIGNVGGAAGVPTIAGTVTVDSQGTVKLINTGDVTVGSVNITGGLQVYTAGVGSDVTLSGPFTVSAAGSVNVFPSTNGNISIGASITGINSIVMQTVGNGTITRTGNFTLGANSVILFSDTGDIGQVGTAIQTSAGTLMVNSNASAYIVEADGVNINPSTVDGTYSLTSTGGVISLLNDITAGTLILNTSGSNGISHFSTALITANNVQLNTVDGDIGSSTNRVRVAGVTNLQVTTSNADAYILVMDNNIGLGASTLGGTFDLRSATGTTTAAVISAGITAGAINIDLDGAGTLTRTAGTLTANSISLTSDSGDIGQSGSPILTSSTSLTASTSGSIYITEIGDVSLSGLSVGATSTLSVSTASNGTITVDSSVTAGSIILSADGTGAISRLGNVTLSANLVDLSTDNGNIGSALLPLQTAAGTLLVSSGGSVFINEADSVNLGASSVTGVFELTTTGSNGGITITGNVSAGSALFTTDGSGNIERSGNSTLTAGVVNLESTTGNFGTALTPLQINANSLTMQTGGSAVLAETNSISLGVISLGGTMQLTTGAGGTITLDDTISASSITLTAGGAGNIVDGGSGSLSASTINLASGSGSIGSSGDEISIAADTLTLNTSGSAYISEADSVTLGSSNVGGTLELTTSANGSIDIAAPVSATTMTLTANGTGDITRSGNNVLTATTMTLDSTLGNIGTAGTPLLLDAGTFSVHTGGSSYVINENSVTLTNSTIGGTFSLSTNGTLTSTGTNTADTIEIAAAGLANSGNLDAADTLTLTGANSSGITVGGGGLLTAASGITVTATNDSVLFSGDQTFVGNATINADGTDGDVVAGGGTTIFSTGNMVINSANPVANQAAFGAAGTLTVNVGPPVPPTPPSPPAEEESTPTFLAFVADSSGAGSSQLVTSRNDPIIISTDQNQGVAGSSLSQSLLSGITSGLSTIAFGGGGGLPASGTISNSNAISNAPNAGLPTGNTSSSSQPMVTTDIDLSPFADLLPSGDRTVTGNVLESKNKPTDAPQALTAQAGSIIPARTGDNKNNQSSGLSSLGETFKVGESRSDLVMFTMANQVFSGFIGGNSDTMVSGAPGTIFSTDKNTVVLHTGRMLTDNGKQGMTVFTQQAAVMIGADSAAVVDVHPGAPTRVMAVAGQGSASTTVRTRDGLVIPLAAGQEVIIGQTDLTDEDLIPVDGMDREFISGGIQVSSRKVAKDNFSLDEFMDKEIMVAGVPVRLGGNNKRLQGKVSAAAKRQSQNSRIADNYHKKKKHLNEDDDKTVVSTIAKAPGKQPVMPAPSQPARVLAEKDTEFSLTKPGYMKLIKGSLFMHSDHPTVVDTPLGQVNGVKGAMFKVSSDEGNARIQAMSGPDHVSVIAGKRLIQLNCGKEAFISDHKPLQSESVPADGVGRRAMSAFALDGALSAIVGDFSMVTLLNSASFMNPLRHPTSTSDQQLHAQIVKAAAVIQQVLGNRGRYYVAPKERAQAPLPDWVIKTTGSKPANKPLLKAMTDAR